MTPQRLAWRDPTSEVAVADMRAPLRPALREVMRAPRETLVHRQASQRVTGDLERAWPVSRAGTMVRDRSASDVARIHPNAISRDGFWCSFSVLEGEVTDEGIFPMNSQRSFSHVITRTSRSAGGAHRAPSPGTVRVWAKRGILVVALVLGSLGAVASASPGHVSTGHVRANTSQRPWMY
jgi:hypothetical protein